MNNDNFENNILKYNTAINRFAFRLTRDKVKAQDLIQESFYKAFKYRNSFKSESNFKSWIFTIIKNTFFDQYKKTKRQAISSKPIEDLEQFSQITSKNKVFSKFALENLENKILSLSIKNRLPIDLISKGYSYTEISEILNIPLGTVKSRINTARRNLKAKLVCS
jgi:RNA polymerase sigma-70 factor (ECF subfamily)